MTGGGFGALDSMNKAIKNNRALQKKRRGFDTLKDNFTWNQKKTLYSFRPATHDQLVAIRKKLRRQFWIKVVKGVIAFATASTIIYFAFDLYHKHSFGISLTLCYLTDYLHSLQCRTHTTAFGLNSYSKSCSSTGNILHF